MNKLRAVFLIFRRSLYYLAIIFTTFTLMLLDYLYTDDFHHILWSLLIIPVVLTVRIYPNWKAVILLGASVSIFKYTTVLVQHDFNIAYELLVDMAMSSFVNWTLLGAFTYLLIRNSKVAKQLQDSNEEVKNQKAFLEVILENMKEQVVSCDAEGRVNYWNDAARPFKGLKGVSPVQWSDQFTFYEEDGKTVIDYNDVPLYRASKGEEVVQYEMWAEVKGSGNKRNLIVNGKPLVNKDGQRTGAVVVFHDMTERKQLEEKISRTKEQFQSLFEHNFDAVYLMDLEGNFITSNPACQRLTGFSNEEMKQLSFHSFVVVEDLQKTIKNYEKAKSGISQDYEITIINRSRERIIINVSNVPMIIDEEVVGVFGIAKDITEQKKHEEKIQYMAYYDQLTSLPNRALFRDRTLQSWKYSRKEKNVMAVMFLDLDGFKLVNDSLGHDIGDKLLKEVSLRFGQCLDSDHTLARMGGDEFTVLLPSINTNEDAVEIADRIINSLQKPFIFEALPFHLSVSIGIAFYNGEEDIHVDTLIKRADTAMYYIKERGKNGFNIYKEGMDTETLRRVMLENDFRTALKKKDFILEYQPIVEMKSGKMVGMESLVRWEHENLGRISPIEFIPLAEETGLIIPLGEWILKTACLQCKQWQDKGLSPLKVSVNVSVKQLQQKERFITMIGNILKETGLEPKWLDLEITETVLMENEGELMSVLQTMRRMGISISIDDFGTGYSSMSHLKNFAVDTLKIDRSFVSDIHSDETSEAIVKSIMTLAEQLQLNTVAEGIENQEQLKILFEEKCKEMQGYYFSPPVPFNQMEQYLVEGKKLVMPLNEVLVKMNKE